MFNAGAGHIGNYDCCSWETMGTGQFRPLEGSSPFLGKKNEIEHVQELKIEMVCSDDVLDAAILALKESHPYETPAFAYWKIQDC